MADLQPLCEESQGCASDVMHFDAKAEPTELYECARTRMEAARRMMDAFAGLKKLDDERALPAVANAASLLLSDASSMFDALYDVIHDHEKLVKACAAIEAETFKR